RSPGLIEFVVVDQPATQGWLLGDDGAPETPQRRLRRVDRLAGFGCHGPLGGDPQSTGKVYLAALGGVYGSQQLGALGLPPPRKFRGRLFCAGSPGAAPDDAGHRRTAILSLCERPLPSRRIHLAVQRDTAREAGGKLVKSGDQPGAFRSVARLRRRHLLPAEGVQVAGGVAAKPT